MGQGIKFLFIFIFLGVKSVKCKSMKKEEEVIQRSVKRGKEMLIRGKTEKLYNPRENGKIYERKVERMRKYTKEKK